MINICKLGMLCWGDGNVGTISSGSDPVVIHLH